MCSVSLIILSDLKFHNVITLLTFNFLMQLPNEDMLVVKSFSFLWSIWNWMDYNFLFHGKNASVSVMQCVVVMLFVSFASKRGTSWLSRVKLYSEWDGSKWLLTCKEEKCYQLWPWRLTLKHQLKLKHQLHCQKIVCSRGKYVPFSIHLPLYMVPMLIHCLIIFLSWSYSDTHFTELFCIYFCLPSTAWRQTCIFHSLFHFHVTQYHFVINILNTKFIVQNASNPCCNKINLNLALISEQILHKTKIDQDSYWPISPT